MQKLMGDEGWGGGGGLFFSTDPKCLWYLVLSIYLYLSIRHTPSYEYYVPGSPQHALKVRI